MNAIRDLRSIGLATIGVLLSTSWAVAQPNPADPDLRAWFKADDIQPNDLWVVDRPNAGSYVKQWVDASSYKTVVAPRAAMNPAGPGLGQPVEEHPTLQMVDINGRQVPTVRFDRNGDVVANAGDPANPGSGGTDRLFQTNNLAPAFDRTHL